MDAVPRISRAQSLDVLSSMANIAGYRAVVEAAHVFGRFFTGQVTAAGKVPPAKVLVAGAGSRVWPRSAPRAAWARSCGRPTRGPRWPTRCGRWVGSTCRSRRPRSRCRRPATRRRCRRTTTPGRPSCTPSRPPDVDIIITTALIPGRPAPRLITAEMVASMKPGSVIVDMAAANGGNVEGAVAGEVVVTDNGVTIIGYTDLAGRLPAQASQLYGTNLVNLMKLLTPGKDGQLVLDFDDVVQRSMTVVRDGVELTWPPPPVQVSAAPAAPARRPAAGGRQSPVKQPPSRRGTTARLVVGCAAALLFVLVGAVARPRCSGHLTVFALAIVIGYYVIGHVHHALHTPLMSVTNAISGIIVVGALLQIGHGDTRRDHGAVDGRDPAGQHQHLRWVRGDPPDARHVLPRQLTES